MSKYSGYHDPPSWQQDVPATTHFPTTSPVAAKDHTCYICRKTITKGTRHEKIVYRDDEATPPQMVTVRGHVNCQHGEPDDFEGHSSPWDN